MFLTVIHMFGVLQLFIFYVFKIRLFVLCYRIFGGILLNQSFLPNCSSSSFLKVVPTFINELSITNHSETRFF